VIKVIDEKARTDGDGKLQFSRQFVARWLRDHTNTQAGGYALTRKDEGPPSKPIHKYKLQFEAPEDAGDKAPEDAGSCVEDKAQKEMDLPPVPF
jgi:hypothetical protein